MRSPAWLRAFAISILAAGLAGLSIGVLARLAMRFAAWLSQRAGALTAERAVVGEMTWSGTIAVLMIGVFVGITGGAVHALARGALPERHRGLLFGALLLALFGWTILDPANDDFRRFGAPWLNYAIFAALFLVFGIATEALARRLERRMPRAWWATALYAPVAAIGALLAVMGAFFGTDRYPWLGLGAFVLLAIVALAGRRALAAQRAHEG